MLHLLAQFTNGFCVAVAQISVEGFVNLFFLLGFKEIFLHSLVKRLWRSVHILVGILLQLACSEGL